VIGLKMDVYKKSMVKVLLASPSGKDTGGIARWTEHILNYYQQHRDNIELDLLPTGRMNVGKLLQNKFLRIYHGIRDYRGILKEESLLMKNKRYDVFHLTSSASMGLFKDYLMLKKAKKAGAKTIIHFRFGRIPDLYNQNNWEWWMIKKVVGLCDKVIVLDKNSLASLRKAGYNHIIELPNPISPRVLNTIENCIKLQREERSILFVGHCYWDKGIKELILACGQIPNIKLVMMGAVEDTIKEELLKLSSQAKWLEIKGDSSYKDVIKAMITCGVFVLPSYTEGFPNVILESMACGCPIVTTDVGAIPEMLDIANGNNNGICVKPKDIDGLREAIMKMLDDRDFAIKCGINAQKRVNILYYM